MRGPFNPNYSGSIHSIFFKVTKQPDSSYLQPEAETRNQSSTGVITHTIYLLRFHTGVFSL